MERGAVLALVGAAVVAAALPWLLDDFLVSLALSCLMYVALATSWAMFSGATRYVSLGSVVATISLPTLAWLTRASMPVVTGGVVAALLIVQRHRGNLARLREGTERRLGQRI